MIKRKVERIINEWIKNPKRALLVMGARQVGKTYTIRECLRMNNCNYVELNLIQNPGYITAISEAKTFSDLKLNLTALLNINFSDNCFLFIDEVQEYKEIITKVKFLVDENKTNVIMSGSILGVELQGISSAPVGYLDEIQMYPLDFEEFLLASKVQEDVITYLYSCFEKREMVSETVHSKILTHLNRYLVVGGMPSAVNAYVTSGDLNEVSTIQENIIKQYRLDFTKYESVQKKLLLTAIYDQIPAQLIKQNKRYNYSDVQRKLRFERLEDSFLWLKYAGVAIASYNVTQPQLPLLLNEKSSLLKLYLSDVGLLTFQYGGSFRTSILFNKDDINLGGVYENFVAQELFAHGYKTYYYSKHNVGELDFVIETNNKVVPLEVKSGKNYYVHSAVNNVLNIKEYQIEEAIVFANGNVERKDRVVYLPIYMVGFLNSESKYPILSLDI